MARIIDKPNFRVLVAMLVVMSLSACVSTEELYAQYDIADCNLIATKDDAGTHTLIEQNSNTTFPWEPAVYFAYNSFDLSSDAKASLDRSMQILKQYPALIIGIQGFTDPKGSNAFNLQLANNRVLAVKSYMQANGVSGGRMLLEPIGEVSQLQSTNLVLDDADNRRVEIILLDDGGRAMSFTYEIKE